MLFVLWKKDALHANASKPATQKLPSPFFLKPPTCFNCLVYKLSADHFALAL